LLVAGLGWDGDVNGLGAWSWAEQSRLRICAVLCCVLLRTVHSSRVEAFWPHRQGRLIFRHRHSTVQPSPITHSTSVQLPNPSISISPNFFSSILITCGCNSTQRLIARLLSGRMCTLARLVTPIAHVIWAIDGGPISGSTGREEEERGGGARQIWMRGMGCEEGRRYVRGLRRGMAGRDLTERVHAACYGRRRQGMKSG
jgi:hypothetical protein